MKHITTQAIILKRLNFAEADRILTVLTPNGIGSLLAKGVRRPKSKLAGGLELFCVSDITYIDGKSDLKTIVSTKLSEHYKNIPLDINRSMVGYDILKTAATYAEHTDESDVYDITRAALFGLDQTKLDHKITTVWFATHILQSAGSGVNLERPLNAEGFDEQQMYSFSYDDMAFLTDEQGSYTPKSIKFLRLVGRSDAPAKLVAIADASQLADTLSPMMDNLLKINRA